MSRSHTGVTTGETEEGNPACSVVEVLDRVAGKWAIGILIAAAHGPVRFSELERGITGISRRMLTLNLRKLEREGLLVRTVYPTVPPRVEYACTEMALELNETLLSLVGWAERHSEDIARAHAAYDAERATVGEAAPGQAVSGQAAPGEAAAGVALAGVAPAGEVAVREVAAGAPSARAGAPSARAGAPSATPGAPPTQAASSVGRATPPR